MDKIIPTKLKLYELSDSGMHFKTNTGETITIYKYVNGNVHIRVPKGIPIGKIAEIISGCFLPGSSFTKRGSIFSKFSSIHFCLNDILIEVEEHNSEVRDIIKQYFDKSLLTTRI